MLSPPTYCPFSPGLLSFCPSWLRSDCCVWICGFFVVQTIFISWSISHYDKNCLTKENETAGLEIWKHCQGYLRTKYINRAQKQATIHLKLSQRGGICEGFKFFANLCFVVLVGTSGTDSSGERRVVSGAKECSDQTPLHINTCFHWHSVKIRERTYSCAAY